MKPKRFQGTLECARYEAPNGMRFGDRVTYNGERWTLHDHHAEQGAQFHSLPIIRKQGRFVTVTWSEISKVSQ